jgi:hypothetical protein
MNTYIPQVNDYVLWQKEKHSVEGWVYFKDQSYLTIETQVTPKHPEDIPLGTHHRNERTLVVCYPESWHQLKYVKTRNNIYEEK